LKLQGGRHWAAIVVLEVSATGLLIEAPAEPSLPIGTTRDVEVDGLRGVAIVAGTYHHTDPVRRYYAIRVVEHDAGLLAAIARRAAQRHGSMRISRPDVTDGE
jgi:hypothetical protein